MDTNTSQQTDAKKMHWPAAQRSTNLMQMNRQVVPDLSNINSRVTKVEKDLSSLQNFVTLLSSRLQTIEKSIRPK